MDNIGLYAGIVGLIIILLVVWLSIKRKCKREGKFYDEQQIRNPGELGSTGTTEGSSDQTDPRFPKGTGREPIVEDSSTGDEEPKGDGASRKLQAEPINSNVNNEPTTQSDSNTIEHAEQVDDEEPEEDIPEVDRL